MLRYAAKSVSRVGDVARVLRCAAAAHSSLSRAFSTKETDSFLTGTNAVYAEEMHRAWLKDPSSVHASWAAYFKSLASGAHPAHAFTPAPAPGQPMPVSAGAGGAAPAPNSLQSRGMHVVRAYQVRGHERAQLDPLGLWDPLRFGGTLPMRACGWSPPRVEAPVSGAHGWVAVLFCSRGQRARNRRCLHGGRVEHPGVV